MSPNYELEFITSEIPAANCAHLDVQESYVYSDGTATVDGENRSSFRIFAIMTALFVRSHPLPSGLTCLSALQLSLFIAALDATIVATAIPTITAQLHSASGYTWIGGAYLLA